MADFSLKKYSGSTGHRNLVHVPEEKFSVKMPMVRLKLATPGYKPSALAIELTRSKDIAGKELSLSSGCIASLYINNCSTVVDFSEKYNGSTGHRIS